ncbi:MAG: methyltransferase [Aureispira sp.]|nr:methyltransferase [Aureispira sp.]
MIDKLRRYIRRLTNPILWRIYKWYLSKNRWYHYEGLKIKVAPSVFHPGLLFSTKILVRFVLELDLKDKKLLELGAGSGLIAAAANRAGAKVLASDINPVAVESMKESKITNSLSLDIIESDLFNAISSQTFDYIIINPPYFPQVANSDREKAFFCGENFEYFHRLFADMPAYLAENSVVYMILSDDCAIDRMQEISKTEASFDWKLVHEEKVWGETNFIFELKNKKPTL